MTTRVIVIVIILMGGALCCCLGILGFTFVNQKAEKVEDTSICPTLPKNFTEADLIGTWVGKYFGDTDTLTIRADSTYKQIYSANKSIKFQSDWQKWYIEHDSYGYVRLHLAGAHRCDGLDSECNNPGGGLPSGSRAINPCQPESSLFLNHEVILFVTGTTGDAPRGIILQQGTLAGSDWTYSFQLDH